MRGFVYCLLLGFVLGGNFGDDACPNDELTLECTNYCFAVLGDCRDACGGNSACINECDDKMIDCAIHCPCRSECPNGCNECSGVFCQCHDANSNEQYLECEAHYDELYRMCVYSCPIADFACNGNCLREYLNNLELCPCQSVCPNGCPCDGYTCPETTTEPSTTTTASTTTKASLPATEVLVLNTRYSDNVPIITNAAGREDTNFDFVFGQGTQVYGSCSMTWKNEFFIFGGDSKKRQVSKLNGCRLTLIGELEFDHFAGACASVADAKLYLCFNWGSGDGNKCRVGTSPTGVFEEINRSNYDHRLTRIAASENEILALGSYDPDHKKAETLWTDRNTWSTIADYPDSLANSYIAFAPILYTDGAFFVFGGYSGGEIEGIGKLDATTKIWSKVGDLNSGRSGHNVIFDGAHFLVIGGEYFTKTENCTMVNGQMTCAEQNPELTNYAYYPELYMVPIDFCKEL